MILLWVKNERKSRRLLRCACCGLSGRKGIEGLSMTFSSPIKLLNPFSCILLVNWARMYTEDHTLSMLDFVDWLNFR